MKRILLFIAGMSFLFSCDYINGPTSINKEITSQYLLNGNLDVYLSNNQIFRYKGKPGIVTISIGNSALSKYENCFVLHVATGATKATTVSSAIIKLDDIEVLNTSDFSKNTGHHTFEICNLAPTSVLTVEVKGQPGSFLDIWIEGKLKELIELADIDGNKYKAVRIGDQVWMAENLKTTHYNDGTEIPLVEDNTEWSILSTPGFCWHDNDDVNNKATYGGIYNWYSVNTGKLCPTGWHVSTNAEWTLLSTLFGGEDLAGAKLKEAGTTHWLDPNPANNETGFTALPGGFRDEFGTYSSDMGTMGDWWSSTEDITTDGFAFAYFMYNDMEGLHAEPDPYNRGFSVRCVKDN